MSCWVVRACSRGTQQSGFTLEFRSALSEGSSENHLSMLPVGQGFSCGGVDVGSEEGLFVVMLCGGCMH